MDILILNSPLFREKNLLYDEDSLPPIGLGLIATQLVSQGHTVKLIDAVAENIPLADLVNLIETSRPSYVCTNIFTTNYELVKELVENISYRCDFIIGGLSTNSLFAEIFEWKTANQLTVIHGDGELIISDIVTSSLKEEPISQKANRRFFQVTTTSKYFVKNISNEKLDRSFFVNEPVIHPLGFVEANIVTSRGCIYNCSFCAAARSLNRDFEIREKSTSGVISEINDLINIYPNINSIRVLDDLFLKNSTSIENAIQIFSNFNLQWRAMAHVQSFRGVSDETVQLLKLSGCNELFIGIESGSPKILKQIHKTHDVEVIKENISKLLRNGINVKGYFIFGFPHETIEDFELTYSLASTLKKISLDNGTNFRTSVFQYRPYDGTEIYHSLEKEFGDDTFSKVTSIEPDEQLSNMVGRIQFNLHSGNYSAESIELVREFVYKTTNLNGENIFADYGMYKQPVQENSKLPKLQSLSKPKAFTR